MKTSRCGVELSDGSASPSQRSAQGTRAKSVVLLVAASAERRGSGGRCRWVRGELTRGALKPWAGASDHAHMRHLSMLITSTLLVALLAGCGSSESAACHDAFDDLNSNRTYALDSTYIDATCERSNWRSEVVTLQKSGREFGWYNG